jgi:hypothetical protein
MIRKFFLVVNKYILSKLKQELYYNLLFLINCIRLKRPFYVLNLKDAKTFNEKINNLKSSDILLKSNLADKLKLKEFDKVNNMIFPRTINVFESVEELKKFDFRSVLLNNGFVVKANHGSGMNLILHKGQIPSLKQINQMCQWFTYPSFLNSREEHYKLIEKKIFIEQLIKANIVDYKFHCFNQNPVFVQVDIDRFSSHKRNFYNIDWELQNFEINYRKVLKDIEPPKFLHEMILSAKQISEQIGLMYLRVDFYETDDDFYLGEITFHPGGGVEPFDSYTSDLFFGSLIGAKC